HDTDWPVAERPAYRLVQDQAAAHPDHVALVACDRTLTYGELNAQANAVARELAAAGAAPGSMVAVLAERDSWAYVMRQAALKAGAAFLPVDPDYPEERVRYILEDSGCRLVLTTAAVLERRADLFDGIADLGARVVEAGAAAARNDASDLGVAVSPHDLAYVIYTSGSTGRPKGVMIENHSLVNFVDDNERNREVLGYTRRASVSLAVAALTFDFAIMEEFVPLANGMTVVLATQEQVMDPAAIARLMSDNGVDVMSCTPSYLSNMLASPEFAGAVSRLRTVDMGAEAFPPDLYARLEAASPGIHVMNGYGPTEATISCTMQVVDGSGDVTIGVPNANVHAATVDRSGRLQPLGAVGELAILGEGVGRGYVGRGDLTARSFVRLLGMPAYRSGDLARIRPDGQIEYRGRMDDQVKLRGLRVELGEIEGVMNSFPGVRTSVCVVVHGETDYLAAYFTAEGEVDPAELRAHLGSYLASYMVPQAVMRLDEMPLTANGKVDKRALPEIREVRGSREVRQPATKLQKQLLGMYQKALGTEQVGVDDDFFEMGGTSLTAAKVMMAAMVADLPITYQDIFDARTVEGLERVVLDKREDDSGTTTATTEGVEPRPQGDQPGPGIERALAHNTAEFVDEVVAGDLGNVLVTGATGFLGMHVLFDLLKNTQGTIYAVVREKPNVDAVTRLNAAMYYYFDFGDKALDVFRERVVVVEGDIADPSFAESISDLDIQTVINCAASVKHFADFDFLYEANVVGAKNLAEYCLARGARLVHVSTISVAGDFVGERRPDNMVLAESALDIGQDVTSNAYVHTKYLAEELILQKVAHEGLDAKIMRVSNLMSREEDGEFQANFNTNNFMNTLRSYTTLGCFPVSEMDEREEFSPIDETARAIVLLAGTPSAFTVFHPINSHTVEMGNVILAMQRCGYDIDVVSDEAFQSRLKDALARDDINAYVAPLVNYHLDDDEMRHELSYDNSFTTKALYRLGFQWSITEMGYLETAIRMIGLLGFFDM
ncbi:MAG: amino acid adenylation domain-containing protein, partial [Olsenella sp.]|nr:amino acid adenylation domain-containing protein [Olsenella sp.]